jgi:hypothetical protein
MFAKTDLHGYRLRREAMPQVLETKSSILQTKDLIHDCH